MIKEIILLIIIQLISIIYNYYLFPLIIKIISYNIYHNIIISLIILIQIDNFTLYYDLTTNNSLNTEPLKPNPLKDDKINGIILNYLTYISKKQDEIYKMNIKRGFNKRISRSYNNLNEIYS